MPKPWVMSPTPALAQQLVDRMDSVLADLGRPGASPVPVAAVELCQVGGLTAGGSLPLLPGRHEFGPAGAPGTRLEPGEVSAVAFRLLVTADGEVRIEPGELPVRVDGRRLLGPEPLGDALVDVGGSAFAVRPSRSRTRRRTDAPTAAPQAEPTVRITVPERPAAPPAGPLHHLARRQHERRIEAIADELDRALSRAAGVAAAARRSHHPDPEQLVHRARTGDRLWLQHPGDPGFGLAPVALGDVPWKPPLELGAPLEDRLAQVVGTRSSLPLVPLLVDLRAGPVAVVGARPAALAVVRHLVVALSVASSPEVLRLSLLAQPGDDWSWLELAPRAAELAPDARELVVVDADAESNRLACERTSGAPNRLGAVLLLRDPSEVPVGCASALQLHPDGTATFTALRTGLRAEELVPLGLPVATAAAALKGLAEHHWTATPVAAPTGEPMPRGWER